MAQLAKDNSYYGRKTPLPIKRLLRQEAGFGCCICGIPIIQYHHIIPWAKEQHFRPEDMMVLCPTHHDKMTKGVVDEIDQRAFKAKPYNKKIGQTHGVLEFNKKFVGFRLGTNFVIGDEVVFVAKSTEVLKFSISDDNKLELSANIYDANSTLIASIDRNEWTAGLVDLWDIEADWSKLTIRSKKYDVRFSLDDSDRNHQLPPRILGKFLIYGVGFVVTKEMIKFDTAAGPAAGLISGAGYYNANFVFFGEGSNLGIQVSGGMRGGGMITQGNSSPLKFYNELKREWRTDKRFI